MAGVTGIAGGGGTMFVGAGGGVTGGRAGPTGGGVTGVTGAGVIGVGCIGLEIGTGVPVDMVGALPAAPPEADGIGADTGSGPPVPVPGLTLSAPQPKASAIPAATKLARTMLITNLRDLGKAHSATQAGPLPHSVTGPCERCID